MSENSFYTPEPWTVEPYVDCEGCYRLREAVTEQREWVAEGYGEMLTDAEEAEGARRNEIAELHDAGNACLMQESPSMFKALKAIADMQVDETTDHAQLSALCMAIAKTEFNKFINHLKRGQAMDYTQKAAEVWQGMDKNEKTAVRVGMFPADKMRQMEAEGYDGHQFVLALMDQANADGGMRA